MNGKAVIPLVAGLCVGGVALKIGWSTLQKAQGAQPDLVQAWTVKEDLARGVTIDESMLSSLKFPASCLPADAVKKKEDLVGRVPRIEAAAGLPVLESMLHPKGTAAGIYVPPGLRAVAVKIDESSGVDYHIQPGSHVDVVGYFMSRRESKQEIVARTLVENVQVAAVGQKLQPGGNEQADKGSKAKPARAVTLLVKPEFVPKLHLAEQRGKIKLSMRSDVEALSTARSASTTEDDILGVSSSRQSDLMTKVFNLLTPKPGDTAVASKPEVKPPVETPVEPTAPPPPPPAWVMNVWNGNDCARVGWNRMDSIEGTRIVDESSEARPARRAKPAPATPPQPAPQKNEQSPAAPAEKNDVSDAQPEPEPEELPE